MVKHWLVAFAVFGGLVGCGASGSTGSGGFGADCAPGETQTCLCADGHAGAQACSSEGKFGACECAGGSAPAAPVCGDATCNGTESCTSCPQDCGECPKCDLAPVCSTAIGVPSTTTARPDLNVFNDGTADLDGGVDGGVIPPSSSCSAPDLRLRLEKITTYNGGATIYCIVNASDGASSEVAITQKTKAMSDGETFSFDPSVGLFWGQKALQTTSNNLTITYNCFRVKSDAWAQVLQAAGNASAQAGGYAGPYGWAFGAGSIAATVAAQAIQATSGDELILNAQQTIDRNTMLDLTNNRSWKIRKDHKAGLFGFSWDWELSVESWGCAHGKETTR